MSIIHSEAKDFSKYFVQASSSVKLSKDQLDKKIGVFTTDKNRFEFLKELRKQLNERLVEHKVHCKRDKEQCQFEKGLNIGYLLIDQELEHLADYFKPGETAQENFAPEEKVAINSSIDEAIRKLNELCAGQQVLFEELEDLKQHLDLDKKSWTQLVKGKLVDIGVGYGLEKFVIGGLYQIITQSIKADQFVLPQ